MRLLSDDKLRQAQLAREWRHEQREWRLRFYFEEAARLGFTPNDSACLKMRCMTCGKLYSLHSHIQHTRHAKIHGIG